MDMRGYSVSWTKHKKEPYFAARHTRRQEQCIQANDDTPEETSLLNHSLKLALSTSQNTLLPTLPAFVAFLLLVTSIGTAFSHPIASNSPLPPPSHPILNNTFRPPPLLKKLRRIRAHLNKINKPPVKTIQAFFLLCLYNHPTAFPFSPFTDLCFCSFLAESRWGFHRLCFVSSATCF